MKAISMLSPAPNKCNLLFLFIGLLFMPKKFLDLVRPNYYSLITEYAMLILLQNLQVANFPKKKDLLPLLEKSKSATGPNGIPYSAYAACIDTSAQILENTTELFGEEAVSGHSNGML